jgi:GT2 family glycosyltransferase
VVVAYNLRELLSECLEALALQTRQPDSVVVVDNASSDGSAEMVADRYPNVDLVRLPVNTGGAGGFAVGIERAVAGHSADGVWVMDDDTIPTPTALSALLESRAAARQVPSVLASRVVWTDGIDHPMNTPRKKPFAHTSERRDADAAGAVAVRSASFVSMLVDARSVLAKGLPIAEYFLWNDDFEFTARILRNERGLYVPASVVVHKTKARADTDADPGERFYFEVRNKLWLFRFSAALSPYEKPLYAAASARRWFRTFLRSGDRATILRTFRAGVRDGLLRRPRSNQTYLASLGAAAATLPSSDRTHSERTGP